MLTESEERLLDRVESSPRKALVVGAIILLTGGSYFVWAGGQFVSATLRDSLHGFDRPIVIRVAQILDYERQVRSLQTTTPLEKKLVTLIIEQTEWTCRFLIFVLRCLVSWILMNTGATFLGISISRRRLASILRKLRRLPEAS